MALAAVLWFPASLLVNSDDPALLSLSDIDCFSLFSGFSPQILFLDLVSRSFCCHKNRHIDLLRFDLLVGIFCRTLMIYRLDCWIMASLAAVIVGFLTCAQ